MCIRDRYESEIETLKTDALNTAKTYALKEQLSKAGVTDADYLIYKMCIRDRYYPTALG